MKRGKKTRGKQGKLRQEKNKLVWWPSAELKKETWIFDEGIYKKADRNPIDFWAKLAQQGIEWFKPWKKVYEEKLPYFKWFLGGKLNACYNCVDRHLKDKANKTALIWIPEPPKEKAIKLTYKQLAEQINKTANVLKALGIKKGDVVAIYLPMIPEVIITILACARIGAIHSVVFSAFSAEALKTRLVDGRAKLLITADGYYRRGKLISLKQNADQAVRGTKVKKVLVVKRARNKIKLTKKDLWWHAEMKKANPECKPAEMDSEDILFILYTSGTTGKPKGIIHTTGGYLVQAYWTAKWDFNLHENDVMWCTSDLGWVTGHTYVCYAPLLNGITTLIYEGVPDWPDPGRPWQIIQKHKVNVFYTSPTALRMLIAYGKKWPKKYDLNSLKVLGTVGEPIDEATWFWYFKTIGNERCPIIDTWWQTETGGTLINALPGIGPFIPTIAGRSFPGTRHAVVDEKGRKVKAGSHGILIQLPPFAPGMLRGIWRDSKRYKETYWSQYKKFYFTSDGAFQDKKGNFRLTGRIDDVLKVAGHRLSTAELENVLDKHEKVDESAIVARSDKIKGEVPVAFVILKKGVKSSAELEKQLQAIIVNAIGPIAKVKEFYFVDDLPKTRSGKIIRRILKSLLKKESLGDLSTLQNPECVEELKKNL